MGTGISMVVSPVVGAESEYLPKKRWAVFRRYRVSGDRVSRIWLLAPPCDCLGRIAYSPGLALEPAYGTRGLGPVLPSVAPV